MNSLIKNIVKFSMVLFGFLTVCAYAQNNETIICSESKNDMKFVAASVRFDVFGQKGNGLAICFYQDSSGTTTNQANPGKVNGNGNYSFPITQKDKQRFEDPNGPWRLYDKGYFCGRRSTGLEKMPAIQGRFPDDPKSCMLISETASPPAGSIQPPPGLFAMNLDISFPDNINLQQIPLNIVCFDYNNKSVACNDKVRSTYTVNKSEVIYIKMLTGGTINITLADGSQRPVSDVTPTPPYVSCTGLSMDELSKIGRLKVHWLPAEGNSQYQHALCQL